MKTPRKRWTNIAQCYVNMVWAGKETINRIDILDYLLREAGLYYKAELSLSDKRLWRYLEDVSYKVYDRNKHLFC